MSKVNVNHHFEVELIPEGMGVNHNFPKSEDSKLSKCPLKKETAIKEC